MLSSLRVSTNSSCSIPASLRESGCPSSVQGLSLDCGAVPRPSRRRGKTTGGCSHSWLRARSWGLQLHVSVEIGDSHFDAILSHERVSPASRASQAFLNIFGVPERGSVSMFLAQLVSARILACEDVGRVVGGSNGATVRTPTSPLSALATPSRRRGAP